MKTYREAVDFLYRIRLFGTKLGLETVRETCRRLGDPQDSLRFIHLAGTNGKGSVGAMLERILRLSGYRVGFFTSPHLVSFRERIRVDGRAVSEEDVVRGVNRISPILDDVAAAPGCRYPTFFEVVVALALRHFAEVGVDVVVWETGMGGRLDATNIVRPELAVITNVQRDHAKYLGDTLEKIAAEKAGIIKEGVPVVTAAEGAPLDVIVRTAEQRAAPLVAVPERYRADVLTSELDGLTLRVDGTGRDYGVLECGLAGRHQAGNAVIALAAVDVLRERSSFEIPDRAVAAALRGIRWPGRFQYVPWNVPLVLDGAHNAPAARVLRNALEDVAADRQRILLTGILEDKDHAAMCEVLAPVADRIVVTRVKSHRTAETDELLEEYHHAREDLPAIAVEDLEEALAEAEREARERENPLVCVTGSLFLVGEVCSLLGIPTIDLA